MRSWRENLGFIDRSNLAVRRGRHRCIPISTFLNNCTKFDLKMIENRYIEAPTGRIFASLPNALKLGQTTFCFSRSM